MNDVSTSHEISRQMAKDKVVGMVVSDDASYRHAGEFYSAFQRNEVVVRIEFASGKVMCGLLSPAVPLPGI